MLHVLKFSSEDCGTCHRMSHYDEVVCSELGCSFVSVMLQDTDTYRRYRRVLLAQYPNKEGMGWPTYLLVTDPEGDFTIHGELLYYALYPNNFKSSPESEMIFSNRNPTFSKSFPEAMLSTEVIATIRFMPSFCTPYSIIA